MFENRKQAGELLAYKIEKLNPKKPFVIGIPRGGVEVAVPIAEKLQAPLYVILPRKLGNPFNPEYAVGAMAPDGTVVLDELILRHVNITVEQLQPVIAKEMKEIEQRTRLYGRWGVLPDIKNRTIILVDDGIATGHTVRAALGFLKKKTDNPLYLGIPVLPQEAVTDFAELTDKLVYLQAPNNFRAVGQFYKDFSDLPHPSIIKLLEKANKNTT